MFTSPITNTAAYFARTLVRAAARQPKHQTFRGAQTAAQWFSTNPTHTRGKATTAAASKPKINTHSPQTSTVTTTPNFTQSALTKNDLAALGAQIFAQPTEEHHEFAREVIEATQKFCISMGVPTRVTQAQINNTIFEDSPRDKIQGDGQYYTTGNVTEAVKSFSSPMTRAVEVMSVLPPLTPENSDRILEKSPGLFHLYKTMEYREQLMPTLKTLRELGYPVHAKETTMLLAGVRMLNTAFDLARQLESNQHVVGFNLTVSADPHYSQKNYGCDVDTMFGITQKMFREIDIDRACDPGAGYWTRGRNKEIISAPDGVAGKPYNRDLNYQNSVNFAELAKEHGAATVFGFTYGLANDHFIRDFHAHLTERGLSFDGIHPHHDGSVGLPFSVGKILRNLHTALELGIPIVQISRGGDTNPLGKSKSNTDDQKNDKNPSNEPTFAGNLTVTEVAAYFRNQKALANEIKFMKTYGKDEKEALRAANDLGCAFFEELTTVPVPEQEPVDPLLLMLWNEGMLQPKWEKYFPA